MDDRFLTLTLGVAMVGVILAPLAGVALLIRLHSRGAPERALRKTLREQANAAQRVQDQERAAKEAAFPNEYDGWTTFVSPYDRSFLGLDFTNELVALGVYGEAQRYPFSALRSVDLVRDGAAVTIHQQQPWTDLLATSEWQQYRQIVGTLRSPTSTVQTVRELSLKVVVDDPRRPVRHVCFFDAQNAFGVEDKTIAPVIDQIDTFHAYQLKAQHQGRPPAEAAPPSTAGDQADALKTLWDLKRAGALSEEEFTSAKARLLAAG